MYCYVLGTRSCRCGDVKNFSPQTCHNDHAVLRKLCTDQTWLMFQWMMCREHNEELLQKTTQSRLFQTQLEMALELSCRYSVSYHELKYIFKSWMNGVLHFLQSAISEEDEESVGEESDREETGKEETGGKETGVKEPTVYTKIVTEERERMAGDGEKKSEKWKEGKEEKAKRERCGSEEESEVSKRSKLIDFSQDIALSLANCLLLPRPVCLRFFKRYCELLFRCVDAFEEGKRDYIHQQDALCNHNCYFADWLVSHLVEQRTMEQQKEQQRENGNHHSPKEMLKKEIEKKEQLLKKNYVGGI